MRPVEYKDNNAKKLFIKDNNHGESIYCLKAHSKARVCLALSGLIGQVREKICGIASGVHTGSFGDKEKVLIDLTDFTGTANLILYFLIGNRGVGMRDYVIVTDCRFGEKVFESEEIGGYLISKSPLLPAEQPWAAVAYTIIVPRKSFSEEKNMETNKTGERLG